MKSIKKALAILGLLGCWSSLVYAQEVTVLYSGQTHAMLYPCSCPIQQDGGIGRRATLVKELRTKYPGLLLLDCGNFTAGGQMDEYTQNTQLDTERSQINYKALEIMQYDAVGVGPDEFNFGSEFFLKHAKKDNPAYLSANLGTDKVAPYIIKESNGVKIAVIGLTDFAANQKAAGLKILKPEELGQFAFSRLKNSGAQVLILLSTQGESQDLKLISKVKGIDIIIVGHRPLKEEVMTKVETTFFLRPAWQGRKLGKLTLKIEDGKLSDCKVEELTLSDKLNDDPEITAVLPRCYADINCREKGIIGTCQNPGTLNAECLFAKPNKVNAIVIDVKDCLSCNTEPMVDLMKKKFPGLTIKNLDYPGPAAAKMIKDLSLQFLPAYILPRSVEKEAVFDSLKNDLGLVNDFYVFKPQVSGVSYFLKSKPKPGNFDLFFSLFEKDAGLLLTAIREFNPRLHFLTAEKNDDFMAKNGTPEVEEYLRSVCVQKYYPEKFWDYLIGRSKNIRSSYWEDCLGGADTARIKSCARSTEGLNLLRENTALNKELQISTGPSYLLDNQEIFSSRKVPDKELFKKILKH